MLEIFYGTDVVAVRNRAHKRVAEGEAAGARTELIDTDTFVTGIFADAVGSTSLFGEETVYVVDTPSSDAVLLEEFEAQLSALGESQNLFVVIEGVLLAPTKKKYQKHAAVLEEFKAAAAQRFNTFAMADALLQKDKKSLWVLWQQAKQAGLSAEEVIGVLWWQLKTLRLASQTPNAASAGLKDFPYNKAKRALSKFAADEPVRLSHDLITLYHDGHAGRRDIDIALERWLLTL